MNLGRAGLAETQGIWRYIQPDKVMGSDLTGLYDDKSSTFTGATWVNQTGLGDLTQGTGGLQAGAGTAINGRATRQTDGTDDFWAGPAGTTLFTVSAGCLIHVCRPLGTLAAGPHTVTSAPLVATEAGGYIAACIASDPRAIIFDTGYRTTSSPGTMVSGTVYQLRMRWGSGTLYYRLRDASGTIGEGSVGVTNIGSLAGLFRVGRSYLANYQQADHAAIITCKVMPSAAQLRKLDAWTKRKWGV